jgi:hypothetical protein
VNLDLLSEIITLNSLTLGSSLEQNLISEKEEESSVELQCYSARNTDRIDKVIVEIQRNLNFDSARSPLNEYQSEMGNIHLLQPKLSFY